MKCPLLKGRVPLPNGVIADEPQECLKEGCAWWLAGSEKCPILETPQELLRLAMILSEIRDKMPHEE